MNNLVLIDIDGVIRNYVSWGVSYIVKKYMNVELRNKFLKPDLYEDLTDWDLKSLINPKYVDDPRAIKYFDQIMKYLFDANELSEEISYMAPLFDDINTSAWNTNVYNKLKSVNLNVYFCTTQPTVYMKSGTSKWVDKYMLKNDGIIFSENKHQLPADWLLDDRPQTVKEFNHVNSGTAFLFRRPWNQTLSFRYSVKSVYEFVNIVVDQYS